MKPRLPVGTSPATALPLALAVLLCITAACAHRPPSIAHVHIGHAVTAAHDTPERVGYFTLAEQQARSALAAAEAAVTANQPLDELKGNIATVDAITNTQEPYALTRAIDEAASHIGYAALSNDASDNLRASQERLAATVEGVLTRGTLIANYARDIAVTDSADEAMTLAQEVHRLTRANVHGEDVDGDGAIGSQPREYGVVQIRQDLDALIAREDPPYVTVDRWYLFNLIRLPSGEWIFRRSGSRGSGGYK